MATATIQLTDICPGGNHLTFVLTHGARTESVVLDLDQIQGPLTEHDLKATIGVIARLVRSGRTLNQARTILQTGVSIGQ